MPEGGMVKCSYNRARSIITTKDELCKEEHHLDDVFIRNGYPHLLFVLLHCGLNRDKETENDLDAESLISIPYVSGMSEDIMRICHHFNIIVAFKSAGSCLVNHYGQFLQWLRIYHHPACVPMYCVSHTL